MEEYKFVDNIINFKKEGQYQGIFILLEIRDIIKY